MKKITTYPHALNRSVSSAVLMGVIIAALFFLPSSIFAKIGVGMGSGEIRLTEGVKPGGIYTLPSLRVFNTGDEVTTYGMGIAYHDENKELRPHKDWFVFDPATFTLSPETSQEVSVTMVVPVKTEPGDYFAFVESGPVASNAPGTSVGVAVASKLFFTVVPANIWQAASHRTTALFAEYSPWSYGALVALVVIAAFIFFRKFFSFNMSLKK